VDELVVDPDDVHFCDVLAENNEILVRPVRRPVDLLRTSRVLWPIRRTMTRLVDSVLSPAKVKEDEIIAPSRFNDIVSRTSIDDVVLPAIVDTVVTTSHEVHLFTPGALHEVLIIGAFDNQELVITTAIARILGCATGYLSCVGVLVVA